MTIQDILDLAKAGYTKEDIAKLTQAADPQPAAENKPQQADPPEKAPENKTPTPAPAEDPAMTAMQAQIDALKQMMNINNMLTVNQQQAPKERTIDDIFAEIINPPVLNKDNGGK